MKKHRGGCHCGAVIFTVLAPKHVVVTDCNCSICTKTGFLHLIVPADQFELLEGKESITTYTFNTRTAQHKFCKKCGVKSFYIPRSHPDGVSVNIRCVDQSGFEKIEIRPSDGKEWEKQYPGGRGNFTG